MKLREVFHLLVLAIFFLHATAEPGEFNVSCWDMTNEKREPRASLANILQLADVVESNTLCYLSKKDDVNLPKRSPGQVGDVYAWLHWTRSDINKGVYEVHYNCGDLATRIRRIANACAGILKTDYLSFWTVLNGCDAVVINKTVAALPDVNQSGIALNVNGGRLLMPDLKERRLGKPFAKITLLAQEDESPMPGW